MENDFDERFNQANQCCRRRDWLSAADLFSQQIAVGGPEPELLLARALARLQFGQVSEALVDLCGAAAISADSQSFPKFQECSQAAGKRAVTSLRELAEAELAPATRTAVVAALTHTLSADKVEKEENQLFEELYAATARSTGAIAQQQWALAEEIATVYLTAVRQQEGTTPQSQADLTELREAAEVLVISVQRDSAARLLQLGQPARASVYVRRAIEMLGATANSEQVVNTRIVAAKAALVMGALVEAIGELEIAARAVKSEAERASVGEMLANIGDAARERDEWVAAAEAYLQAAELYETAPTEDLGSALLASTFRSAIKNIPGGIPAST